MDKHIIDLLMSKSYITAIGVDADKYASIDELIEKGVVTIPGAKEKIYALLNETGIDKSTEIITEIVVDDSPVIDETPVTDAPIVDIVPDDSPVIDETPVTDAPIVDIVPDETTIVEDTIEPTISENDEVIEEQAEEPVKKTKKSKKSE